MVAATARLAADTVRYRVSRMDCPSSITKIETTVRKVPGVAGVGRSIASQEVNLAVDGSLRIRPGSPLGGVYRRCQGLVTMLYRRQTILAFLISVTGIVAAIVPHAVRAERTGDCSRPGVTVIYDDPIELEIACSALADIFEYFRRAGFSMTPKVELRFVPRANEGASAPGATHGYFDAPQSQIVVFRSSGVSPWGLTWSLTLAASFLRHELVHMAIWEITKGDTKRWQREWHEFVAYAIQLDLMEPDLLAEVLIKHAQIQPFAVLSQINEFTYYMNPEAFAVAAYKTYLAKGGVEFVRQLLRGEVVPPPLSYPFPVLPDKEPAR